MKKIILEITDDAFEDISNYLRLQYMCGGSIEGIDSAAMAHILRAMASGSEKVTLSLKWKKQSG
jgi:hypothetical protein